MTYKRYWYRINEIPSHIFRYTKLEFFKLHELVKFPITGLDGTDESMFIPDQLAFKGIHEDDTTHKCFYFPRIMSMQDSWLEPEDDELHFDYSETSIKTCDLAIMCFLLIARTTLGKGSILLVSDGDLNTWEPAIKIIGDYISPLMTRELRYALLYDSIDDELTNLDHQTRMQILFGKQPVVLERTLV